MSQKVGGRMYPENIDGLSLASLKRRKLDWHRAYDNCKKGSERKLAFKMLHRIKKRIATMLWSGNKE